MAVFPLTINQAFPAATFNNLAQWANMRVLWLKSHACPCVNSGTPNVNCAACLGRGIYWDPSQGPYSVLITMVSFIGRHIDAGEVDNTTYGTVIESKPILTVPNIPNVTTNFWTYVSLNDLIVQTDAISRYNTVLRVNDATALPAWHQYSLTIAPTGAVTVEDPTTNQPVKTGVTYTVSGLTVTLNGNYPLGTTYTVEYTSAPTFIIHDPYGGLAHVRPFGAGDIYPKRFRIDIADLFLRDPLGLTTSVG